MQETDKVYVYKNHLSLSNDSGKFVQKVRDAHLVTNIDFPEAGLDAIMQSIICENTIKWRKKARHLLVYSSG